MIMTEQTSVEVAQDPATTETAETAEPAEAENAEQTEETTTTTEEKAEETTESPTYVPKTKKKLFVGNVNFEGTSEQLKEFLSEHAGVKDVHLLKNKFDEGKHRGFGFVEFDTVEDAEKVLGIQNLVFQNKVLNINLAKGRTKKFFIGGIDREKTNKASMEQVFKKYGEIADIFVVQDRGFGFVTMVEDGDNLKVLENMQWIEINEKKCEIKPARPREANFSGRGRGFGGYGGYGGGYGGPPYGGYGPPPMWGGAWGPPMRGRGRGRGYRGYGGGRGFRGRGGRGWGRGYAPY